MATFNVPSDMSVNGDLRVTGDITPKKAKTSILAQTDLAKFPIPLTDFVTWDAMGSPLPSAGANDDLGLVGGTHGTNTPALQADDHKAEGSAQVNYGRVLVQLPWNYVAGQTVQLRFMAGMITTVASTDATLDIQVYKQEDDPDDAIGSDLASAAVADNMNSTTFANIDFTITATSLSAGDILDVLLSTSVDDTGTGTAVIAAVSYAQLLCDVL